MSTTRFDYCADGKEEIRYHSKVRMLGDKISRGSNACMNAMKVSNARLHAVPPAPSFRLHHLDAKVIRLECAASKRRPRADLNLRENSNTWLKIIQLGKVEGVFGEFFSEFSHARMVQWVTGEKFVPESAYHFQRI